MAAQVEGTAYDGEDKPGNDSEFVNWLHSQNAGILVEKLLAGGVDSMEMLKAIEAEPLNQVATDLNLTTIQKAKLNLLFREIPNKLYEQQAVHIADKEEINAVVEMVEKLASVEKVMNDIDNKKQKLKQDELYLTQNIEQKFDALQNLLQKKKKHMLNKLNQISQEKTESLNQISNRLSEQYNFTKQQIKVSRGKLESHINFIDIETRKQQILKIAENIKNMEIAPQNCTNHDITIRFDDDLLPLLNMINDNEVQEQKDAAEAGLSFVCNNQNKSLFVVSNNGRTVQWKGKMFSLGRTIMFGRLFEGTDKLTIQIEVNVSGNLQNYSFGFISKSYNAWDNHNHGMNSWQSIWITGDASLYAYDDFKENKKLNEKLIKEMKSFLWYDQKNVVGISIDMKEGFGCIWNDSNREHKIVVKLTGSTGIALGFDGSDSKIVTVVSVE
eukprot:194847_1